MNTICWKYLLLLFRKVAQVAFPLELHVAQNISTEVHKKKLHFVVSICLRLLKHRSVAENVDEARILMTCKALLIQIVIEIPSAHNFKALFPCHRTLPVLFK